MKKPFVFRISLIILIVLNIISILYAVTMGSVDIAASDVYRILMNKIFSIGNISDFNPSRVDIVYTVRLPRLILAGLTGIGLPITGIIMQSVVKNPLADPYILGVSSGATLGATLAIVLGIGVHLGSSFVGILAFLGAFAVSVLVIMISNINGRANSVKLLLSGMAVNILCSSVSSFLIFISKDREASRNITFWLMGAFSGAKPGELKILSVIVFSSFVFYLTQARMLNLMLLGDEVSVTLGYDLNIYRHICLAVNALLTGFLIYNTGIIGFVGLLIPHFSRLLVGSDHRKLLLISPLLGSLLLIWSDVLSRMIIKGSELPVGIIISLIGSPLFIFLMVRKSFGTGGQNGH